MPENPVKKKKLLKHSSKSSTGLLDKITPVLLVAVIGLSFLVGILWQKVVNLEGGGGNLVAGLGTNSGTGAAGTHDGGTAPPNGKLSEDQVGRIPEVTSEDHVLGSRDAEVFLIEYSDLECPFCKRFHPTAQQAVDDFNGDVAWVFRHFPLSSIHPRADAAALASECAAELGGDEAFWSFVDAVFADQPTGLSDLSGVASSIGVDVVAFDTCVAEGRHNDKIKQVSDGGSAAGVTGTPGNFIVNRKGDAWIIPGAVPFESIKLTIDEALAS